MLLINFLQTKILISQGLRGQKANKRNKELFEAKARIQLKERLEGKVRWDNDDS
jgi:hypothetical protein